MTRTGKIARLPKTIREQLNLRLADGELGANLVRWLNQQPAVKTVLADQFQGHAITEQNLSEWRQGGHADWLREQELQHYLHQQNEQDADLDQIKVGQASSLSVNPPSLPQNDQTLTDRMSRRLALKMAMLQEQRMDAEPDPEKKWELACALNRELARLRREDHHTAQRALARERSERQQARQTQADAARTAKRERQQQAAVYYARLQEKLLAEKLGGGDFGLEIARTLLELRHDLPAGQLQTTPLDPKEARFQNEHPHWTPEQLRDEVLQAGYGETLAGGGEQSRVALAEKRFEMNKTDIQARALEICLNESKPFPAVQEMFQATFRALHKVRGEI